MTYETVTPDTEERLTYEVIASLPVDQFEAALGDKSIKVGEQSLRGLLSTLEQDHVRQSVRAKVSPDLPVTVPGQPPAASPALLEELERRIKAVKGRLPAKKS